MPGFPEAVRGVTTLVQSEMAGVADLITNMVQLPKEEHSTIVCSGCKVLRTMKLLKMGFFKGVWYKIKDLLHLSPLGSK